MSLLIIAVVALAVFLLLRSRKAKVRVELPSSSPAVDRWLKESLPAVLAERLSSKGVDKAHLAEVLGGSHDASVVSEIEQAVKAIEVEYARDHASPHLDVRARIRFNDGTEENISTRIAYTEAPAGVRDDFERKATSRAFRKWEFPWMSAS
jgi:hypothetical protein